MRQWRAIGANLQKSRCKLAVCKSFSRGETELLFYRFTDIHIEIHEVVMDT